MAKVPKHKICRVAGTIGNGCPYRCSESTGAVVQHDRYLCREWKHASVFQGCQIGKAISIQI